MLPRRDRSPVGEPPFRGWLFCSRSGARGEAIPGDSHHTAYRLPEKGIGQERAPVLSYDPDHSNLSQFLGQHMRTEQAAPQASRAVRATGFAAAVAIVAVATAALVVPPATYAASAVNQTLDHWDDLPTDLPLDVALPQHTIVLDKNGAEFARFYSENRIDVPLDRMSPHFVDALIATEDARFYTHNGVDPQGVARAAASNAVSGNRQGASTITQQLVQNILVNNARDDTERSVAVGQTYNDKIREVKYSLALEETLSKDEILETYANMVYFGNQAYGVEAAAKIYFDTTAKDLTQSQAAMLVGLLRGPNVYDPYADPEAGENRRNTVLARLAAVGAITDAEAVAAQAEPLTLSRGNIPSGCAESTYPFYCALVREEVLADTAFGDTPEQREDRLSRGGLTITTALDPAAMDAAKVSVDNALDPGNRVALGTAMIVPGKGEISAVAQNREWGTGPGKTEIVYANRPFQVGSSMKPISLVAGLEQGIPVTQILDSNSPYKSQTLDSPEGGFINYNNGNHGAIDGREAIKRSSNIYFIRLIERTGVLPVADVAARLGITSLPREGERAIGGREASLTLGAYEITPIEMANAYSAFVSQGTICNPHTITAVALTRTGEALPAPEADCHEAIAPAVANTVADTLKAPLTPGGTLENLQGLTGRESGAKTGTTDNYAANWIVGVTPDWSTAVWLGDPEGGPANPLTQVTAYGRTFFNLTGSEVAAPVWKETMDRASAGLPARPLPKADDSATSATIAKAIPDVRGLPVNEALTILIQNNLTPVIEQTPAEPGIHQPNTAVGQSPAPGSPISYTQEVHLTLSSGSVTSLKLPVKP